LFHLEGQNREELSIAQTAQLDASIDSLKAKHGDSQVWSLENRLLNLERSAYADLTCHALEHTLRDWSWTRAKKELHRAEFRDAMEKIKSGEFARRLPESGWRTSYEKRLMSYAKHILDPG
jgi:hypothetical protein